MAILAVTALALGACKSDAKPDAAAKTTSAPAPVTTASTTTATATPTDYVESGDYVNGRHMGLVTSVDASAHTIDVDIVQFLTGDAAIRAYRQDSGDASGTPDNDYYVRNQNKQIRHLTAAPNAALRVQSLGNSGEPTSPDQGKRVTWADFAGYWKDKHDEAVASLFWITLRDSRVVAVEQQFVP